MAVLGRSPLRLGLALVLAGCGGAGGDGSVGPGNGVTAVQISDVPTELLVGASASGSASAMLASGAARAVTTGWSASPAGVVSLTPTATGVSIKGLAPGSVTLTASDGGKSATAVVVVENPLRSLTMWVPDTVRVGRIVDLSVIGVEMSGTTYGFTSVPVTTSNASAVAINGLVATAMAPGSADLIVHTGGLTTTRHVVVEAPPVRIDVRMIGTFSPAVMAAAQEAAARWQDTFASAWPAVTTTVPANTCVTGQPVITGEAIAGVRIYVIVDDAATVGVVARGGACTFQNQRTVLGRVLLSSSTANSAPSPALRALFVHEFGHVMGVPFGPLSTGIPGEDPRFLGAEALRQFVLAGGVDAGGVPLEPGSGIGPYSHWRVSQLPGEVMNGRSGLPTGAGIRYALSAITLGSLVDMGYPMRLSSADPYRVSGSLLASRSIP